MGTDNLSDLLGLEIREKYTVISEPDLDSLEEHINGLMADGWRCEGGIMWKPAPYFIDINERVMGDIYLQAMSKTEKIPLKVRVGEE